MLFQIQGKRLVLANIFVDYKNGTYKQKQLLNLTRDATLREMSLTANQQSTIVPTHPSHPARAATSTKQRKPTKIRYT